MKELTDLERTVLLRLLEGDDPLARALRDQVAIAEVRERKFTGTGFFTDGVVHPPLIGDVKVRAENLRHGADFALFVKDGLLDFLEGYRLGGEPWPVDVGPFVVLRDAPPWS